jgi:GxxExxY protein
MGEGIKNVKNGKNHKMIKSISHNFPLIPKMPVQMKYGDITEKIIGAAFRVHGTLGCGFREVIYQRALELEFKMMNLEHAREFEMPVYYHDIQIGTRRVDFLVMNTISVELKAVTKLEDVNLAQAMNYLEAYNLEIGLLINFGSKRLEFHRFTNKKYNPLLIQHPIQSQKSH